MLREINTLKMKNSSKKLQQRHEEISAMEKVLISYELHLTNYLKWLVNSNQLLATGE